MRTDRRGRTRSPSLTRRAAPGRRRGAGRSDWSASGGQPRSRATASGVCSRTMERPVWRGHAVAGEQATTTIVTNATGTLHAAGWPSSTATQPSAVVLMTASQPTATARAERRRRAARPRRRRRSARATRCRAPAAGRTSTRRRRTPGRRRGRRRRSGSSRASDAAARRPATHRGDPERGDPAEPPSPASGSSRPG